MPFLARRASAVLIATGVSVSTAALLAGPAAAAGPPALSFLPAKGLASTPMYLVMPAPCPAAATNVVAQAFGHGFPASGQTVVTNSTAGVSHSAPFILPLQDTFVGFAADNGTTLSGPYRVTLRCISRLGNRTYASYSASVTFSDKAHFTAPVPTPALVAAIQAAEQPALSGPSSGTKPSGKGQPGTGQSGQPQAQSSAGAGAIGSDGGTGTSASAPTSSTSRQKKSDFPWQPTLIVAAFVLIGLGLFLRIREVRRGARRDASRLVVRAVPSPTTSPDPPKKSPSLTGSASSNNHVKGNQS